MFCKRPTPNPSVADLAGGEKENIKKMEKIVISWQK